MQGVFLCRSIVQAGLSAVPVHKNHCVLFLIR